MNFTTLFEKIGIHSEWLISSLSVVSTLIIMILSGIIVNMIIKKWLAKIVLKISSKTPFKWDNHLLQPKFFNRLGLLMIPITIMAILNMSNWNTDNMWVIVLSKILNVWIIIMSVSLVSEIFAGINRIYESFPVSKDSPITVFIQLIMVIIWLVACVAIVRVFVVFQIATLLATMTAMAAVLMLIFQDSILGFVAGIQLSANDMLHIGDWIEMPAARADGDVVEINLTTVKVQNFDKTITTIPTSRLVKDSFTNWRGMEKSDGRRIKRSINIDVDSIRYLTEEDLDKLRDSSLLKDYIDKKIQDLNVFNAYHKNMLDARRLTNIGTFREYIEAWLTHNPDINLNMTHMVRQLQPGPTGIPLEIYCFSARKKWVEYERVQSDIFDHMYSVMKIFGLKAFQYTGGISQ